MMKTIGILGAGIMGAGIAQIAVQAGFNVIMRDTADDLVSRGLDGIHKNLARRVQKNRLSREEAASISGRIKGALNLADLAGSDFVIEAINENMELKKDAFGELDRLCPPATFFATNTSNLSITEMASATKRADRFIGMHFFNPVPVMKLVEIIKGKRTDPETVQVAWELAEKMGKEPILVNEAPLFVVNRLLNLMLNEAMYMLMEGVTSAEDIDKGMRLGANHPIGPIALLDLVGLDTVLSIMETVYRDTGDVRHRPCPLLIEKVQAGHLGKKTGRGFYEYK